MYLVSGNGARQRAESCSFGKIAMKLPLFGKLNIKTYSSQFARTLSTLMYAGIPLIHGIDAVTKLMKNRHFQLQLQSAREEVAKGVPLSEPLRKGGLFPPMVIHMLSIGEETGDIEGMLDKLADYYDEEVEMTTQTVMAAMEPINDYRCYGNYRSHSDCSNICADAFHVQPARQHVK